jgi:hypothetical protein
VQGFKIKTSRFNQILFITAAQQRKKRDSIQNSIQFTGTAGWDFQFQIAQILSLSMKFPFH